MSCCQGGQNFIYVGRSS